jgi:hypothetical protein
VGERLEALQKAAEFAIYTPGSDAGLQVSILASLKVPSISWDGNRELLREKISSTVTALLTLIGLQNIHPMRSREHILLSNIFEMAWSSGQDLDLSELISQTQAPPFDKLGVFPVETFFPEKDRLDLALLLNNFLAAPVFQTWLEGQALELPTLLYTASGQPRHSIFYLAHLNDAERMFFIILLFSAIETWMRTQGGASGLRALVYFDEITGYLPPVNNPPSKMVILRLLKQARAFGVGLLLASQNPVDLDYKALANAGTWMIGKLQTDQDKQRLLDGLLSADGSLDRAHFDQLIGSLGKRMFVLHNIHRPGPLLFQTRWTMNYLAGPLTRMQIPALNRLAGVAQLPQVLPAPPPGADQSIPAEPGSADTAALSAAPPPPNPDTATILHTAATTRPVLPSTVSEYFMPTNLALARALEMDARTVPPDTPAATYLYHPALLAQARLRYLEHKYSFEHEQVRTVLVRSLDHHGLVRWDEFAANPVDAQAVMLNGLTQTSFAPLQAPLDNAKILATLQKDFIDWAYRTSQVRLRYNPSLNVSAGPEISTADFRQECSQAARAGRDDELNRIDASFDARKAIPQGILAHAERILQAKEEALSEREREEFGTKLENFLRWIGRNRRRLSSSSKHRLTEQAQDAVNEARADIDDLQKHLDDLEQARQQARGEASDRWARLVEDVTEIPLSPLRKDVYLELFGVIWLPFYVLQVGSQVIELPAFE